MFVTMPASKMLYRKGPQGAILMSGRSCCVVSEAGVLLDGHRVPKNSYLKAGGLSTSAASWEAWHLFLLMEVMSCKRVR